MKSKNLAATRDVAVFCLRWLGEAVAQRLIEQILGKGTEKLGVEVRVVRVEDEHAQRALPPKPRRQP